MPRGRQLIQSYGAGRFRVAEKSYKGSILLTHSQVLPWLINDKKNITVEALSPLLNQSRILIVGCGGEFSAPPENMRSILKDRGMSLEWMDTGAACRTFNILLIEERDAVAALIAVD